MTLDISEYTDPADPFFAEARVTRPILDQVADKWSLMILIVVCHKPTRFNAIKRRLEGISHKALAEALRRLERNGLLTRRVIATSPVAVEYSVTAGPLPAAALQCLIHLGSGSCSRCDRSSGPL
jgi:DNA-binding HxlR family transcriptional regulator